MDNNEKKVIFSAQKALENIFILIFHGHKISFSWN
jgi:hypothetical protein